MSKHTNLLNLKNAARNALRPMIAAIEDEIDELVYEEEQSILGCEDITDTEAQKQIEELRNKAFVDIIEQVAILIEKDEYSS